MLQYLKLLISGRVNRITYLYSYILLTVVFPWLFVYIPYIVVTGGNQLPTAHIVIASIPFTLWLLSVAIRRFHDTGHRGAEVIVLIIPFVNIFYGFWLIFKKGVARDNMHGSQPKSGIDWKAPFLLSKRNTLLVPLFLLLLSAIYANIVPDNKTLSAPSPQSNTFTLLRPQPNEELCIGDQYTIIWEEPNIYETFLININEPDGSKSTISYKYSNGEIQYYGFSANEKINPYDDNSRLKGYTTWQVGAVVEQGELSPSILKPGMGYTFEVANANGRVTTHPFTLKDCTKTN